MGFVSADHMEDRAFTVALCVSLLIHVALIGSLSTIKRKIIQKPLRQIEVTYQAIKPRSLKNNQMTVDELKVFKKKQSAKKVDVLAKKSHMYTPMEKGIKDITKMSDKLSIDRKRTPKITPMDVSRNISVPMLKSEKITNPKYLSYNQTIRQKIRQKAYSYINHPDFKAGNVYLTFVLLNNGKLKQIQIIEEKTTANSYLKDIGLRSVKESHPFPAFPKDLNYPELTFNVVISFEVNE